MKYIFITLYMLLSCKLVYGVSLDDLRASLVRITVTKDGKDYVGSGFFIDNKGRFLTNYHVIKDMKGIKVKYFNLGNRVFNRNEVEVKYANLVRDIAVLKIKKGALNYEKVSYVDLFAGSENDINTVGFNDKSTIVYNTPIMNQVNGFPRVTNYGPIDNVIEGINSENNLETNDLYQLIMLSKNSSRGSSGSPVVLNSNHRVIGMAAGSIDDIRVFAIPVTYLVEAVEASKNSDIPNKYEIKGNDLSNDKLRAEIKAKLYREKIQTYSGFYNKDKFTRIWGKVYNSNTGNVSGADVILMASDDARRFYRFAEVETDILGEFYFDVKETGIKKWKINIRKPGHEMKSADGYIFSQAGVSKMHDIEIKSTGEYIDIYADPKDIIFNKDTGVKQSIYIHAEKVVNQLVDDEYEIGWVVCDVEGRCNDNISTPSWIKTFRPNDGDTSENEEPIDVEVDDYTGNETIRMKIVAVGEGVDNVFDTIGIHQGYIEWVTKRLFLTTTDNSRPDDDSMKIISDIKYGPGQNKTGCRIKKTKVNKGNRTLTYRYSSEKCKDKDLKVEFRILSNMFSFFNSKDPARPTKSIELSLVNPETEELVLVKEVQ